MVNVSSKWPVQFLLLIVIATVGCFKNPGQQSLPAVGVAMPITPVYNYSSLADSYLSAVGSCNGNSEIEFNYFSDIYTTSQTVTATCSSNRVDARLPVGMGIRAQTYTVTLIARLRNNRSTPVTVTVAYSPPPSITPGFKILSGGGKTSNAEAQIFSFIGEVASPGTVSNATTLMRVGVQGVNDP